MIFLPPLFSSVIKGSKEGSSIRTRSTQVTTYTSDKEYNTGQDGDSEKHRSKIVREGMEERNPDPTVV